MPGLMQQGIFSGGSHTYRGTELFPDPFADAASTAMPTNLSDVLRWTEFIYESQGTVREALKRIVSYFITDVEVSNVEASRDEKNKYVDFLQNTLDIRSVCYLVAMDYIATGNSFTSLHVPFRRYLSCPQCHAVEAPLRTIYNAPEFKFSWSNYEFHATCPSCHYSGAWDHNDRRGGEESELKVKRWSPHEIEILYDDASHDCAYIWKIPDDYRRTIKEGKLFHLERVPWEVIQAIKNNNVLLFNPDVIYHMKDETLAGARNKGWGISKLISCFRDIWYVQVLKRYNEAIALDYIVPFRVITPMPKGGAADAASQDPVLGMNMGNFTARIRSMLRNRRRDPAAWHIMPYPLQYTALGGDANTLAPKDLLDQGNQTMLNALGIPAEMYMGTLTMQAAQPALRLFESYWSPLTHNLNGFISWLVEKLGKTLNWEPFTARLTKVTQADDLQKQMAKLQLMMGRQISQTTGLKSLGMDFEEEQKGMLEEEQFVSEETQKMQEEMQASQAQQGLAQGGGAPPGGDPAAGGAPPGGDPAAAAGGGAPAGPSAGGAGGGATGGDQTVQETLSKAQDIAGQLGKMPDSQRRSEMIALKKLNPTLHSLVKSQIDDTRQQAQTQGGAQVMAQQQKSGALLAPLPVGLMTLRPRSRRIEVD